MYGKCPYGSRGVPPSVVVAVVIVVAAGMVVVMVVVGGDVVEVLVAICWGRVWSRLLHRVTMKGSDV